MIYDLIHFSGSGARIASHLGAANALKEEGVTANKYSGISGGAVIATLAAMDVLSKYENDILSLEVRDIYRPAIFNKKGNIRPFHALFGWMKYGPNSFASMRPMKELLLGSGLRGYWDRRKAEIICYLYEKGKGLVSKSSKGKTFEEWVDILAYGSSIPFLVAEYKYSDAGIIRQLPILEDVGKKALAFVTNQSEETPFLVDDILQRVAKDNIEDEAKELGDKVKIVRLKAYNRTTEYNPKLSIDSMISSYILVRSMYE